MKKIEFFSVINGVTENFPVDHARNFKFKWVENARQDYKQVAEKLKGTKYNHLFRCPGIFDLMNTGYIVPMPWDLTIETKGDGKHFAWNYPDEALKQTLKAELISAHLPETIAKHLPKPPGTLESIVKLHTPWHIVAPKGVKFLMIPIPYGDEQYFENVTGMLDPSISSEVHIQLRWKVLMGRQTIKAGTPMAQLIPISEDKFDLDVRDATKKDLEWYEKRLYLNNCTMVMKHSLVQQAYWKFWETKWQLKNIINRFKNK